MSEHAQSPRASEVVHQFLSTVGVVVGAMCAIVLYSLFVNVSVYWLEETGAMSELDPLALEFVAWILLVPVWFAVLLLGRYLALLILSASDSPHYHRVKGWFSFSVAAALSGAIAFIGVVV